MCLVEDNIIIVYSYCIINTIMTWLVSELGHVSTIAEHMHHVASSNS